LKQIPSIKKRELFPIPGRDAYRLYLLFTDGAVVISEVDGIEILERKHTEAAKAFLDMGIDAVCSRIVKDKYFKP